MKQLIESQITINDILEVINRRPTEIFIEAGWHSFSSQPKIKMIEQPLTYGNEASTCNLMDVNVLSLLGSIKEIITVNPKPNQYLGALIHEKTLIIQLPRKSKYTIYSWDVDGHLIKYESSIKDRLLAIEGGVPFSISTQNTLNPPLYFFFNEKLRNNFFKTQPSMDSNNQKSKYFI